ncbi:hypothetical protein Acr_07g0000990 [Actinidia rufa]|uniref:Uncharacterized protein n=1 Tax=Actinidia rufa TaxID=165716 RepID=A0A7J0EU63_9ERIC|nr:hypothetical protein Acr_07g0000990 [Actinidia rufa]
MNSVVSLEAGQEFKNSVEGGGNKFPGKSYLSCIGYHEYFSPEMWRAALTELVATATLMFTLTTTIISCLDSHGPDPKLAVPFVVFTIAFLFLIVMVPLTGGHMSPVFTFIAFLKGVVTLARASIYIMAQCVGSIMGFLRRCKELGLVMVCAVVAGAMAIAVLVSITVTGRSGYAGVGLNPAREGLVWVDGEYDFFRLAGACLGDGK